MTMDNKEQLELARAGEDRYDALVVGTISPNLPLHAHGLLRDVLPRDALTQDHLQPLLDVAVASIHDAYYSDHDRWPGLHKNVSIWWTLENGKRVGWNENPGRGWSFPVLGRRKA